MALGNLAQYYNLIRPGVYQWQRDCPPGADLRISHNYVDGTLEFSVNDEIVVRLTEWDFADGKASLIASTRYKMLARAWEMERELAPIRAAAAAKSEALLRKHLTEAQKETLDRDGWFEVVGNYTGATYRIYKDLTIHGGRNVVALSNGHPSMAYGAAPCSGKHGRKLLPWGDVLLAQKLDLECDESGFRYIACKASIVNGAPLATAPYWPGGAVINPYPEINQTHADLQRQHHQYQAELEALHRLSPGSFIPVSIGSDSNLDAIKIITGMGLAVIAIFFVILKLVKVWAL